MSAVTKLVFPESEQEIDFKDGDGGGGDGSVGVENINIKVVSNGFLITTEYVDGDILEEVCHTMLEVFDIISENVD